MKIIILIIAAILNEQQSFDDFLKQEQQGFDSYKESLEKQYAQYEKAEKDAFEKFKKDVEMKWNEFRSSTSKTYVSYDDNLESRASVDYENGELLIEVILDQENKDIDGINHFYRDNFNPYRFGYRNQSIIGNFLSVFFSSYNSSFQNADHVRNELRQNKSKPLLQVLAKTKLVQKLVDVLSETDQQGNGILDMQLSDDNGNYVNPSNAALFAEKHINNQLNSTTNFRAKDGKERKLFKLSLSLREDHLNSRLKKYRKEIIKQANRFNVEPAIALAITETESSFNPKATSHIPAYGLMQLVPSTGARDAYKYVYKKDKVLKKDFLYKPKNNIELGCAYLAMIRHNWFKSVNNNTSAYMCTVAAYNTGIGNVAKALTNQKKISLATRRVNQLSSKELYNVLIRDLEYEETKKYLKKVWTRKDKYAGIG